VSQTIHRPPAPDGPALLDFIRDRAAALVPPGTRDILDAGAGEGLLLQRLKGVRRAVALDLDPQAGCRLEVKGDIARLPFPAGSFDAAACLNVFNTLPYAAARDGLAELVRVVRPGGTLILNAPNLDHLLVRLRAVLWRNRRRTTEPCGLRESWLAKRLGHLGARLVTREWISPEPQTRLAPKRWLAGVYNGLTACFPRLSAHALWVAVKKGEHSARNGD